MVPEIYVDISQYGIKVAQFYPHMTVTKPHIPGLWGAFSAIRPYLAECIRNNRHPA